MKKTIVVIRHAKAAEPNGIVRDFDRPLTDRGKSDAVAMGGELKKSDIVPDLIISSNAKRTRQTAKRIAIATGYDVDKIEWKEKLYHCTVPVIEEVIAEVNENVKTVFIVGHNPGIAEFAYRLDPNFNIPAVPTCCIVAAQIEKGKWAQFTQTGKKVFLYKHP